MIQVEVTHESIVCDGRNAALISIKDVTEELRAEAERQRVHEAFAAILKASPLAIYAFDLNGNIQFCNDAGAKSDGLAPRGAG